MTFRLPDQTTYQVTCRALPLALGCALWLLAGDAYGRSAGFVAEQCGGCHRGNATSPRITITPDNPTPMLGQKVRMTISIEVGAARGAGFYVGTTSGKLSPVSGEKTKAGGEGVTHNGTNTAVGGKVVFHADWTVPATPGGVDFRAAAIAANMDGGSGGDVSMSVFYPFAYGCSTAVTYYRDFDGDGVGYDKEEFTRSCGKPAGYGEALGDCDDNDAKIKPGAKEACNRRDDNCDGKTDEGLESLVLYPDADGDGWGRRGTGEMMMMGCGMAQGWGIEGNDCDDNNKLVFPDAVEVCNLQDDDCDGRIDEGARAECGEGWCRRLASACDGRLCTPGKPREERCNLLDDDCDGQVDEDSDSLCTDGLTCRDARCVDSETAPLEPTGSGGTADAGESVDDSAGTGSGQGPSPGCSLAHAPRPASALLPLFAACSLVRLLWRRRQAHDKPPTQR